MKHTITVRLSYEPGQVAALQMQTRASTELLFDAKQEFYGDSPFFNLWLQCWASTKENVRRLI